MGFRLIAIGVAILTPAQRDQLATLFAKRP